MNTLLMSILQFLILFLFLYHLGFIKNKIKMCKSRLKCKKSVWTLAQCVEFWKSRKVEKSSHRVMRSSLKLVKASSPLNIFAFRLKVFNLFHTKTVCSIWQCFQWEVPIFHAYRDCSFKCLSAYWDCSCKSECVQLNY